MNEASQFYWNLQIFNKFKKKPTWYASSTWMGDNFPSFNFLTSSRIGIKRICLFSSVNNFPSTVNNERSCSFFLRNSSFLVLILSKFDLCWYINVYGYIFCNFLLRIYIITIWMISRKFHIISYLCYGVYITLCKICSNSDNEKRFCIKRSHKCYKVFDHFWTIITLYPFSCHTQRFCCFPSDIRLAEWTWPLKWKVI